MTANSRTPVPSPRRSRRQAVGAVALAAALLAGPAVLPTPAGGAGRSTVVASARAWPWDLFRKSTTTVKRTTVTTVAKTTTTKKPATTTTRKASTTTTRKASTTTTRKPTTTTTKKAPTTTVAPTTTLPTTPCGPGIAKSDGSAWQCTFVDDFNGSTLDGTKWVAQETAYSGFYGGGACMVDRPANVSVADGSLRLTVRREDAPFVCIDPVSGNYTTQYTSGMVSTWDRFSQTYGRFEVRAKISSSQAKGLQSALWLWPQDAARYGPWPLSGEIDIAEMYSLYPDRAIPYIHYSSKSYDPNVTNNYCYVSNLDQYHTYVAEWTPDSIRITFDGTTCLVDSWDPAAPLVKPQPFDHPYIVALTQALGIGANGFDPAVTELPATTQVDYVRVWK